MHRLLALPLLLLTTAAAFAQEGESYAERRKAMVEMVKEGVRDRRVLSVVAKTERHRFVPKSQQGLAYFDLALPIGHTATISPPYVVAFMTEQLAPKPTDKVLEIGTGSGYQAAILSPLVKEVYTIEIVEPLGREAAERLRKLGYKNVRAKVGDGYKGWPEHAPFDKIIVTCSPEKIPQPLVDQLKEGGRMVIPLGGRYDQSLCLVKKTDGKLTREVLESTFFIPMTGRAEELRAVKPGSGGQIDNGGFERLSQRGSPLRWYYLRQFEIIDTKERGSAPEGAKFIRFRNETPGRMSQALQAFGIDGLKYSELNISARIKTTKAKPGEAASQLPSLQIQFYNSDRKSVGIVGLGPFSGSQDWTRHSIKARVPLNAKLAVVGVGLFGGVGEACFDDIRIVAREE